MGQAWDVRSAVERSRPSRTVQPAGLRLPPTAATVLSLQRYAGNHAVTRIMLAAKAPIHPAAVTVQRCGHIPPDHCPCHRQKNGAGEASTTVQRTGIAGSTASVRRLPMLMLLRAQPIKDDVHLASALLTSNTRLESAFHNDPPLTPSDDKAAIAVLQEALENVFRALPKSHDPGTGGFDGKWGTETRKALRDYQSAHSIPPGGHEAGRRTLAALDAELRGGPKPKPPPKPTPPRCNYLPGEREQAQKNDGDIEGSGNRFRLTGFSPGDATLKPAHERFLRKLILQRPFEVSGAENGFAVGVTDCVSEEGSPDRALRLERARSVVRFVSKFAGAGFTFTALDDPTARITGDNDTPAARARNRAVDLTFSRAPCDPKRAADARKSVTSAEATLAAARARLARAKADEVKVALSRAACGLMGPNKGAEECYKAQYPEQKRIAKELRESPIAIRAAEQNLATARAKLRAAEQELAQCSSGGP